MIALAAAIVAVCALVAGGLEVPRLPAAAIGTAPADSSAGQVREALGDLPVTFVENRGQADDRVRYQAQGPGYAFFFTPEGIVMSLSGGPDAATRPAASEAAADGVVLSLGFVGSNPDVVVEGRERAPGQVNYLRGNDPVAWQTGLPAYTTVWYRELWPGIDLALRGDMGQLKYEFHVQPGARVSDIRLAYAGANGVALDPEGGLLIDTPVGELRDSAPVAYQQAGGERVPVDTHYLLADGQAATTYGFAVGAGYQPDRPLVIDPGLEYSTFLGGASHEAAHDVAVDGDGNAVVVGITQSEDFPTTPGAVDRTFNGGVMDVFVAKLNADGSGLVYATYMGGTPAPLRRGSETPTDIARAVAVDADGNAYVTGQTTSPDFPTTSGAFQPNINASPDVVTDAFVSKLGPTGSLAYSTFLGGAFWDDGRAIALDGSGSAYVVGETSSNDFPTTAGAVQPDRAGNRDAFLAKLNPAGSALQYSTYLGGASELDRADAVAVDGSGRVYLAGSTRSVDFPTTAGAFQPDHSGGGFADLFEVFVAKIDPAAAGSAGLTYSTFLGTTRMDLASDLAVDASGNAYVTGSAGLSAEFPTTAGAYDTAGTTGSRGFVTKLNAAGSDLVYSTFFRVTKIALEADGSAWLAGGTGAGAETTADAFARESSGGSDGYLARLDAAGSALEFATYLGGAQGDGAAGLALGPNGSVFVAGNTMSPDFPTTVGAFDRTWAGDPLVFWGDAFVAKFAPGGSGETTPPPAARETTEFSGRIDKNRTVTHNLAIEATGEVDLDLNWDESRVNLTLRVRDPSGASVFFDGSSARPKSGSFTATATGAYRFELTNTTDRRANYTLAVTHPTASSPSQPSAALSLLSLNPTSVTGGDSATGTVALTAAAPSGGASVLLSSGNTDAATVPTSVTVPAGQTSATFTVSTNSVSANTASTISATFGGVTRTATLEVNAAAGPELSTLVLSPNPVAGGSSSTGTVTLSAAAPSGGASVALSSSNTAVATVPSSVTVPAGSTSATFSVSTSANAFDQSSAISASHGGVTRTVILSVTASGGDSSATLSSLSLNPTSVAGGDPSTGTVTLSAAAPSGGATVALSSSNTTAATVPASVTVPAGSTSATFTVSTSGVSSDTSSTILAGYAGTTRTATLAVNAPASTTDTVTISRLEYRSDKRELRVEASSSSSGATLRAYVTSTDQLIGTLSGGKGEFSWPTNPGNVKVRSSLGGSASRDVTLK